MFDPELARSTVYFEKQEVGSQLCVLHCLNNVLQGPYFTLEDLAAISTRLDDAERALLHGEELLQSYARDSLNSSETGFFSVQVLQAALSVYGVH
jgi:ataxin-3